MPLDRHPPFMAGGGGKVIDMRLVVKARISLDLDVLQKIIRGLVDYGVEEQTGEPVGGLASVNVYVGGRIVEVKYVPCTSNTRWLKYNISTDELEIGYEGSRYGFGSMIKDTDIIGVRFEPVLGVKDPIVIFREHSVFDNETAEKLYREIMNGNVLIKVCIEDNNCFFAEIVEYKTSAPEQWCLLPTELVVREDSKAVGAVSMAVVNDPAYPIYMEQLSEEDRAQILKYMRRFK